MTLKTILAAGAAAVLITSLAACVSEKPPANLAGLKTAKASVIKWRKGSIGVLPSALANTVKTCWSRDALFEGFKAGDAAPLAGGSVAMRLDGPLAGEPPQRFLVVMTPMPDDKPGYVVDMEYPVGSNYEFVRARLARDIATLENGQRPCS
ncbi:MAG: hypothetical protein K2P80_00395 [Beijerinckiaceae bacterium]|nr:hypothetical protein [Beijerinckiaceae bacterium]